MHIPSHFVTGAVFKPNVTTFSFLSLNLYFSIEKTILALYYDGLLANE